MPTPNIVQSADTGLTPFASTTISKAYANAQVAGDTNVICIEWSGGATIVSVKDNSITPVVYTAGPTLSAGGFNVAIFYHQNIAAATAGSRTITVTFSASSVGAVTVAEIGPNGGASLSLDLLVGTSTGATVSPSWSGTTADANELVIANFCGNGSSTPTAGVGWTAIGGAATRGLTELVEDQSFASAGAITVAGTNVASSVWVSAAIGIFVPPPASAPEDGGDAPQVTSVEGRPIRVVLGDEFGGAHPSDDAAPSFVVQDEPTFISLAHGGDDFAGTHLTDDASPRAPIVHDDMVPPMPMCADDVVVTMPIEDAAPRSTMVEDEIVVRATSRDDDFAGTMPAEESSQRAFYTPEVSWISVPVSSDFVGSTPMEEGSPPTFVLEEPAAFVLSGVEEFMGLTPVEENGPALYVGELEATVSVPQVGDDFIAPPVLDESAVWLMLGPIEPQAVALYDSNEVLPSTSPTPAGVALPVIGGGRSYFDVDHMYRLALEEYDGDEVLALELGVTPPVYGGEVRFDEFEKRTEAILEQEAATDERMRQAVALISRDKHHARTQLLKKTVKTVGAAVIVWQVLKWLTWL